MTSKRTVTQDIGVSIILTLIGGLVVGALAAVAGLVSINEPISPWLASGAIIVGSTWLLNRHMLQRLNRVYFDHKITPRSDRVIIGVATAMSTTFGYSYTLSAIPFIVSAFTQVLPVRDVIFPIVCGPIAVLMTVVQQRNISAIVPWLVVGAWLTIRALTYNPSPEYLAFANLVQTKGRA